jgi:CBS domain containing-hemolysin-like protein
MPVLIFIDQSEGHIKKSSFEALSYGAKVAEQLGTTAEGIDTLESGNKSILGDIRGQVIIAEDAKGGIKHTVLVMQNQRVKSVQITFLRVLN